MGLNIKCNIPSSISGLLARETQKGASEGATFKDAATEAAFVKNIVRESDLLPHRWKQWLSGIRAKFNFADSSKKSFEELGDAKGAEDLGLFYKQHQTKSRDAVDKAGVILDKVFEPIQSLSQQAEVYRILLARSNYERARRGLKTQHNKDAQYWNSEITHLMANASPQAKAVADDIFSLMREIGMDLERRGLLGKGTVAKNGEYVPHDVLEFLERDNLLLSTKTFRLKPFEHSKQAHGSEKELYTDFYTSLMHYLVTAQQRIADGEFLGKLISRFSKADMGEYLEIDGKKILKRVKDPSKYAVWRYDKTNYNAERVHRALNLHIKDEFVSSMKKLAPDMSPAELDVAWENLQLELSGKGQLVILPKGLVEDLVAWEKGKYDNGMGKTLRSATAAWKRNMVGRIGLYTGMKHFRDMRGDFQQALRDDPESLALSSAVAQRLLAHDKGIFKHIAQWQTKGLNELAKAGYKITGKEFNFTEAEFTKYLTEARANGVLTGKFLGEGFSPGATISSASRKLYSRLSEKPHIKALGAVANKRDEIDHLIRNLESVYRLSKYIRDRQRGHTEASATKRNGDTFVDYQLLTPYEQKWLRDGLFPFYTFRKGNTLAWTKRLFDPKTPTADRMRAWGTFLTFSTIPIVWNHMMDPEGEERLQNDPKNKYIANTFHLFLGRDAEGNAIYLTDPLPSSDIDRLLNLQQFANIGKKFLGSDRPISQVPEQTALQFLNVLNDGVFGTIKDEANPLIKLPFEFAQNQSFFYKIPIRKTDEPSYVQLAQLGHHFLKTWDRQYATLNGLFFNKAPASIDMARLFGMPINAHKDFLSRTNAEQVEAELFGGVVRPQVPKEEAFIDQYERLMRTKVDEDTRSRILEHYPTIRQLMAERYADLVDDRVLRRQDLIKKALAANGIDPKYSLLYKLPEEQRRVIVDKIKDQKWYRQLTFISDKDRQKVLRGALDEAGL